jgi:hypothetical protein
LIVFGGDCRFIKRVCWLRPIRFSEKADD